jgi:AcrR family transcriptional regulator
MATRPADRPQRPSADATRRCLLDAGRARFSRAGYAGTSVQDVMRDAQLPVSVLYHHFGDKLGLYVAVAEEAYEQVVSELETAIDGASDFGSALAAVLSEAGRMHSRHPDLGRMTFTVQVDLQRDPTVAAALQSSVKRFRSFIDQLVDLAPGELVESVGVRNLSRAVVAILQGLSSVAVTLSPNEYRATIGALSALLHPQ